MMEDWSRHLLTFRIWELIWRRGVVWKHWVLLMLDEVQSPSVPQAKSTRLYEKPHSWLIWETMWFTWETTLLVLRQFDFFSVSETWLYLSQTAKYLTRAKHGTTPKDSWGIPGTKGATEEFFREARSTSTKQGESDQATLKTQTLTQWVWPEWPSQRNSLPPYPLILHECDQNLSKGDNKR